MEACRLSDEARAAVNAAVDAAKAQPMTHAEEVKALMAKGMKITITDGQHCVWALAPRKIAESMGAPFIAVLPAAPDLASYMAHGGQVVTTRA
jgi:hypothetical protein